LKKKEEKERGGEGEKSRLPSSYDSGSRIKEEKKKKGGGATSRDFSGREKGKKRKKGHASMQLAQPNTLGKRGKRQGKIRKAKFVGKKRRLHTGIHRLPSRKRGKKGKIIVGNARDRGGKGTWREEKREPPKLSLFSFARGKKKKKEKGGKARSRCSWDGRRKRRKKGRKGKCASLR